MSNRGRGISSRGRSAPTSQKPQHESGDFPQLRRTRGPGMSESAPEPRTWGNPPPAWGRAGSQQQQQQQSGYRQQQEQGQQQGGQQGQYRQQQQGQNRPQQQQEGQYRQQQHQGQQGPEQRRPSHLEQGGIPRQPEQQGHPVQQQQQQQQPSPQQQQEVPSQQKMIPKGVGDSNCPSGDASTRRDFKNMSLAPSSVGRGSSRGGYGKPSDEVYETTIVTKPKELNSKQGQFGQKAMFKANYFVLETHTDWCLYHYHVDFNPEEDRTAVRKRLVRVHKDRIGGYIFDGSALFTSVRLGPDCLELFSTRDEDDTKMRINLKLVADLALGDHHYIQLFNILMRQAMGLLNLNLIGRNFFDSLEKTVVPEYSMEIWPGYVTSIRQHENKILMCVEITHKVLRTDTVVDLYRSICSRPDGNNQFLKMIIGQIVLTNYNQRTYRVDDVDFTSNPDSVFKLKTGEEVSYKEYIRKKYRIKIQDCNQPMIISRPKARDIRAGMSEFIYLIPELCQMTGLTDDMRNDFGLMRKLSETTRVAPSLRVQRLLKFNNRLRSEPALLSQLGQWNLRLSESLITFPGRVIPRENIFQCQTPLKLEETSLGDWSKEMRGKTMLLTTALTNWTVVCPRQFKKQLEDFLALIIKTSEPMKFRVSPPLFMDVQDDKPTNLVNAIEKVISTKNPQLVMTIVSNTRGDRYSAIKKKCCVDRAVASQVVLAKTLRSKTVMSIATKVAVQMNCKLGGSPWTVEVPLTGLMVFGFDVCHDSGSRGKSYGALVGSLDKTFTRYFSAVSAHQSGEELSNDLVTNVIKALHKYREFNQGNLPQRILIYRDGVGDGNIPYVMNHEIELLKAKLKEVYGPYDVKMAFIIVSKRINTRIFTKHNDNPMPGTVVDDEITLPHRYDFFLVSQSVRQGTVSPTSYNVISDNIGLSPDKIQRLTYKFTHLYYNWSGTVRVPAPVQYAHKLAFLVGQSLHVSPHNNLNDVLYFL